MITKGSRKEIRVKKHNRMRNRISGTAEMPRLSVFRSDSHIYAQVIDDVAGRTLVSASTTEKDVKAALKNTDTIEAAEYIGDLVAKRAKEAGISKVVFDRGGFIYQGKVRKAGLEF